MSITKKSFSAREIQKQLGLKRYEPVWGMVHKLRTAMGKCDERYTLEGMIEFDEGYFTVESSEIEQENDNEEEVLQANKCSSDGRIYVFGKC